MHVGSTDGEVRRSRYSNKRSMNIQGYAGYQDFIFILAARFLSVYIWFSAESFDDLTDSAVFIDDVGWTAAP